MADPSDNKPLGALGTGQERLRGRGRGRGLRKFAPVVAPRRTTCLDNGIVKPTLPKLLEVVQRPEKLEKVRPRKFDAAVKTTVAFVANDAKKSSSFVPNDRGLRVGASIASYPSTPSGSPLHHGAGDMDIDDEDMDGLSSSFAPLVLPMVYENKSLPAANASDDIKPVDADFQPNLADFLLKTASNKSASSPQFMFWQLPCQLPVPATSIKSEGSTNQKLKNDAVELNKENDILDKLSQMFSENRPRLPSGFLGKIVVYKSGKVLLRCGEVDFVVNSGTDYPFRQEMISLDKESLTCHRLGVVTRRIVCTPDLSVLGPRCGNKG